MSRRFRKVLSIVTFRVFLAVCVAIAVGITNNFLINFSNSPDLKLLIPGNMDDIKPVGEKYHVTLMLENRGATVSSSRVKIKIARELAPYVAIDNIEKQLTVGDAVVTEPGFTKDSENDTGAAYKRDVEFKVFSGRNYDLGSVALDFSKNKELRVDYSIIAESMVKRIGYYIFRVQDGNFGIKEARQWKDNSGANVTGWGKFFRYLSGKNIR